MAKLYEEVRIAFRKEHSEYLKNKPNPKAGAAMQKARLGSHNSVEANEANRKVHLGNKVWLGKHHSEETKIKLSKALKGKPGTPHTLEARKKISNARLGKIWYTDGNTEICTKNGCPEGFTRGRLKRKV